MKYLTAAFAVSASLFLGTSQAAYPEKPIKFILPYPAGGTTDLVARTVSQHMATLLKQPVVVENKPGAGGNIGMAQVARARPDGYTVGMGAISTNAVNPYLYKDMPFNPEKDFTAISMLGTSTIVLEVNPQTGVKTVPQFIEYVKKHPGAIYGTAGTGTSMHLAAELFAQKAGIKLTHAPYKGSAPALQDMLGGRINIMFDNLPASLPHIKSGKLTALAVAGVKRNPQLPDVPTINEAGLRDYAVDPWFALYGPAGMDDEVVKVLNEAVERSLADPQVKKVLENAGFNPESSTPDALATYTEAEQGQWGEIIKTIPLQAK